MNDHLLASMIRMQNLYATVRATMTSRLRRAEQGQSLVEYALILSFIALAVIVAMKALQPAISTSFNHVRDCLNGAQTQVPATPTTNC